MERHIEIFFAQYRVRTRKVEMSRWMSKSDCMVVENVLKGVGLISGKPESGKVGE